VPTAPAEERPSIAVLPLNNMSNDPEQEYFSDGISEDTTTDLSKIAGLRVVARTSSFAYKGKTPDFCMLRAGTWRDVGAGRVDPPGRQPHADNLAVNRRMQQRTSLGRTV